jgi:glycerophosphoryl diester phosphodiesterase
MPLIIAHRGASADAPENTLAAFALALQQGADMLELDVQQSADGVLVVFHDDTTERWNGYPTPITTTPYATLQLLDIAGERMPTLEAVCRFAIEQQIMLNIEIKQAGIAAQIIGMIRRHRLDEQVLLSSFHMQDLHDALRIAPHIQRGSIMGKRMLRPDVRLRESWPFLHLKYVRATAWHPNYQLPLLKWVLPLVRKAGYAVSVWTVDEPATMQEMVRLGATGIITNKPAEAVGALQRWSVEAVGALKRLER